MLKKYDATSPDFVNTSEAFSKIIFIGNNNVAIPYINIDLMDSNPITGKQSVVDYSYYVFLRVRSMLFEARNGKLAFDFNFSQVENFILEYIMVGGYQNACEAEVKIECEKLLFYVSDTAKFGQFGDFMPVDTPDYKMNMIAEKVDNFFLVSNLPEDIKVILGENIYSLNFSYYKTDSKTGIN